MAMARPTLSGKAEPKGLPGTLRCLSGGAWCFVVAATLSGGAITLAAQAADGEGLVEKSSSTNPSGLALPRFVSLRSGEVNLRTGPGRSYPIEWVYVRAGMPVEVTAEFDTWRRIRDQDGVQGWVHQSMLSGRRTLLVTSETRTIRDRPAVTAAAVALAEPGVMGRLVACKGSWCEVEVQGYHGWLQRQEFWGIYQNETVSED
jgi:SH3-like domain-containing protein